MTSKNNAGSFVCVCVCGTSVLVHVYTHIYESMYDVCMVYVFIHWACLPLYTGGEARKEFHMYYFITLYLSGFRQDLSLNYVLVRWLDKLLQY